MLPFVDSDSKDCPFVCEPVIVSQERNFHLRFMEYANLYSEAQDECESQCTAQSNRTMQSSERRKRAQRTKKVIENCKILADTPVENKPTLEALHSIVVLELSMELTYCTPESPLKFVSEDDFKIRSQLSPCVESRPL